MTGAERLEQVREALHVPWRKATDEALAALDGCVLLTAEEAAGVAAVLGHTRGWHRARMDALALLTPEGSDDD